MIEIAAQYALAGGYFMIGSALFCVGFVALATVWRRFRPKRKVRLAAVVKLRPTTARCDDGPDAA